MSSHIRSARPGVAAGSRGDLGWARRAPWLLIVPDAPPILPDHFSAANIHDLPRRTCVSLSQGLQTGLMRDGGIARHANANNLPAVDGTRPPCALRLLLCGNFQRSHHGRSTTSTSRAALVSAMATSERSKRLLVFIAPRHGGTAAAGDGHTGCVGCV